MGPKTLTQQGFQEPLFNSPCSFPHLLTSMRLLMQLSQRSSDREACEAKYIILYTVAQFPNCNLELTGGTSQIGGW